MIPMQGPPPAPGTPLAIRLPNWVGDVCMAVPAINALAAAGWDCRLFGRGWARDLLAGLGHPVTPLPRGLFAGAKAMRGQAQVGLLFTNSFGSAAQMRWAGIRATGYPAELRGILLARRVRREARVHEVAAFWRLACDRIGGDFTAPPQELGLRLADGHREQAAAALAAAGVTGAYVVLCPLAVGTGPEGRSKVYPGFPLLCRGLIEDGTTVVACPGPGEDAACAAQLPGAKLLPGLGLGAYAAVMASARFVVANDSGPMHLAAAVSVPVLGIFGVTSPRRTSPWGQRSRFIGSEDGWPPAAEVWKAVAALAGAGSGS
jgi:heptosyltransferase-2